MHCCLCGKEIDNSLYKKCTKCSGRGSTKCQLICTTCYATRGTCNTCFGLDNTARLSAAAIGSSLSSEEEAPSDNQRFLSTAEQTATSIFSSRSATAGNLSSSIISIIHSRERVDTSRSSRCARWWSSADGTISRRSRRRRTSS